MAGNSFQIGRSSVWEFRSGLFILMILAFLIIGGPLLSPHSPNAVSGDAGYAGLSANHPLGTDYLGRDVLARVLYGGSITVSLALIATLSGCIAGTAIGFFSALAGKSLDTAVMAIVELFLSIPPLLFALILLAGLGPSIFSLVLVVSAVHFVRVARIARALAFNIVTKEFVEVARARGDTKLAIMFHEVLPNLLGPLAVEFGLRLTFSVLLLSALSFLGLGIQPPLADWGVMVRENLTGLRSGALAAIVPAAGIAVLTVGVNLIIDAAIERSQNYLETIQ